MKTKKGRLQKKLSSLKVIGIIIITAISLFILLIIISTTIYSIGFRPYKVSGNSMAPSYLQDAYIISEKITYQDNSPQRGDVVIVKSPRNPDKELIQRIVGLPYEKIMVKDGRVYINGTKLDEPYLAPRTYTNSGEFLEDSVEFQIPENFYILMGDNRSQTTDSRVIGPISHDYIKSKVSFCYANCP